MKPLLYAAVVMLFMLAYVGFYSGMGIWWDGQSRKSRLRSKKKADRERPERQLRWRSLDKLRRHVSDLLLALGWRIGPFGFAACCCGTGLSGALAGAALFQSGRSALLTMLMCGTVPYVLLRMSLMNRQMATRLEFLPAVELFYQSYLVTGCRHVRIALQKTVEERRLPGEVQAVFDQLYRNLSVKGDDEGSLRRFSLSFGNLWAEYFGNILKIALGEGNNVSENLKELISDMRKAQLANQKERHRLLEIRLANYTPVAFLALFMGVNFKLNPEGSYAYYIADPGGRSMLLNAVLLLFGSFLMGLYLSRKKL